MNKDLASAVSNAVNNAFNAASVDGSTERVVGQVAALTRAAASSPRLASALSAGDVGAEAKQSLLNSLSTGLHYSAVELIVAIGASARSSIAAFLSALTDATAELAFLVAGDRLRTVEAELHGVAEIIRTNVELRAALTDPGVIDSGKEALLVDLLRTKVNPLTLEIVRVLVGVDHGRNVDVGAEALSVRAAAHRNLVVANIRTAVALDDDHKARLTAALEATVGSPVEPRFIVDESIVGSVIVRVGDEVLDGSVRRRLAAARDALVGAA